jgi:putative MATE family efflux protein
MSQALPARAAPPPTLDDARAGRSPNRELLGQLLRLTGPLVAEQALHLAVGLTDVYVAGHLPRQTAAAQAAVGSIAYILWLLTLVAGTLGIGSTALISRAVGARHRRLANSVCGQTVTAALIAGAALGAVCLVAAGPIADLTGLAGDAHVFARSYMRILSVALPLSTLMLAANACLRGAGDTLTPAISMIVVDSLNVLLTVGLSRGRFGMPDMGFDGIAVGTAAAYLAGGLLQFGVLLSGRGKLRLHLHRLRPHWHTMRRILRIGLPAGLENLLGWGANFVILKIINEVDRTNVMGSAHICTIRIEAMSFLCGYAVATATATMVGQSLGARDPARATRAAYLAFAVGGGVMALWGLMFVLFPGFFAGWLATDPQVAALSARCLFITGFAQVGFAAYLVFSFALRGAGDTVAAMAISLASILGLRLSGAVIAGWWLHQGLAAIWIVLAAELVVRGSLVYGRFLHGGWRTAKV